MNNFVLTMLFVMFLSLNIVHGQSFCVDTIGNYQLTMLEVKGGRLSDFYKNRTLQPIDFLHNQDTVLTDFYIAQVPITIEFLNSIFEDSDAYLTASAISMKSFLSQFRFFPAVTLQCFTLNILLVLEKLNAVSNFTYQVPTSIEWEYACLKLHSQNQTMLYGKVDSVNQSDKKYLYYDSYSCELVVHYFDYPVCDKIDKYTAKYYHNMHTRFYRRRLNPLPTVLRSDGIKYLLRDSYSFNKGAIDRNISMLADSKVQLRLIFYK